MSDSAATVIQRGFEAFATGGVEASLQYFTDDFEFTTPAALSTEPDTYSGHEGLRRYFESFYEIMDRVEIVPVDVDEIDAETAAVTLRLTARGRATGLEATQETETLCRLADGKVRSIEFFPSRADALAAAR
jgi:ketosteroid isomerase-like protein